MADSAVKGKGRGHANTYIPKYKLESFQQLRENKESFIIYVTKFLKSTYSNTWNKKVNDADSLCSIFTVSDEAFVLLVLENNWERWLDINNKSKNNYIPTKRNRGDKPVESDILPLYTNINGNSANAGKEVNRGWTEAGIKRFNELCMTVKEDRKENAVVDREILHEIRPTILSKASAKRRRLAQSITKAYVDIPIDKSEESDAAMHSDSD